MKTYVVKETTYEVGNFAKPRSVYYWGKPRRLWESPYYVEGFKTKGAAERAIQKDIDNNPLSVCLGTHVALENKEFVKLYSVEEIEVKD